MTVVLFVALPLGGGDLVREWSYELAQAGYEGHDDLLDLLQSKEDKELRYMASYLLSRRGRPEDAEAIEAAIPEKVWSEAERVALAGHVARLDADKGERIILRLLEDLQQPESRAVAMMHLAKLGLAPRYDELLRLVQSDDWSAQKEAINALGHLAGSPTGEVLEPLPRTVLVNLAEAEDKWMRWQSVLNLGILLRQSEGEMRQSITKVLCERRSRDSAEEVRKEAGDALDVSSTDCACLQESPE